MVMCFMMNPHPIVEQNDISSLYMRTDVLHYVEPRKNHSINGYYFRNADGTGTEVHFYLFQKNALSFPSMKKKL